MKHLPVRRVLLVSVVLALIVVGSIAGLMYSGFQFDLDEFNLSFGEEPDSPTIVLSPTATLTPTATPLPTPTPLPRGGNLTVRLAEDVPLLQPWRPRSRGDEQMISLLYNGLMRLDEQLAPQPDLARSWKASADGRTITFTLHSGIQWHDGEPLDAMDVQFTLEQMRSLPVTSTAMLYDLQRITAVAVPDTHRVVLSLSERYAPLLAELTLPILPRHLLENRDIRSLNFWDVPVGSGPFQFVRRDPGNSVVFKRNDAYFRGAPLISLVAFVGAADEDVALPALTDGRLLLAEVQWNTLRNYEGSLEAYREEGYPENGFYFLGFNVRQGRPFADVRVRQALAKALDLPRLVETTTRGQGVLIGNSAVPGSWADLTPPAALEADIEGARALLEESGWTLPPGTTIRQRNGELFQVRLLVRSDDMRRVAAARRIAEVAASIGLGISVEPVDLPTLLKMYIPPYDFDLLLGSWLNGAGDPGFADFAYYDPDDFALFHSSQINQGTIDTRVTRNFVGFQDSAYDEHIEAARQLYGLSERTEAYRQAQARIAALLPYLYLWNDTIPVLLSTRISTLDGPVDLTIPNYFWNIERWYIEKSNE